MLGHTDGRRVRKSTRACDRCKFKKLRCSGTQPCSTCASRGQSCAFQAPYLRGRPPTPLNGNVGDVLATPPSTVSVRRRPASRSLPASANRSLALPDAADVEGHYVGPTSALSFLRRAQQRFTDARPSRSEDSASDCHETWRSAGDKPFVQTSDSYTIPSGHDAIELLDLYFDVCVATYRILHRPTVDVWHDTLQQNATHARAHATGLGEARLAILLGVFAIATFHRQRQKGLWISRQRPANGITCTYANPRRQM